MFTKGTSHAAPQLIKDLTGFLSQVRARKEGEQFPVPGCKAIIAPHAGYAYSGATAAWAYKCIDTSITKRVFILGPCHKFKLLTCALTGCVTFETPLGSIPVDVEVVEQLRATGRFDTLTLDADEGEHSIEMQLPILRKVCEGKEIKIVPIVVGSLTLEKELEYGSILAPYFAQEGTLFIASTDFCHWGNRFSYTFYYPTVDSEASAGYHITRASPPEPNFPIYDSISALDHQAMNILTLPHTSSKSALTSFHRYLDETENTICGSHALGVLFGTLAGVEKETGKRGTSGWAKYDQSSQCTSIRESSVSYVSGWIKF